MPCFYAPQMSVKDSIVTLTGAEHHHIFHVLRSKEGEDIILSNGKGLLAEGNIISIDKNELTIKMNKINVLRRSKPHLAIAFPLLRNKHDNMIIEKLTELGVKDFFPMITKRTVRKPSANTVKKFEKVAVAAMKQCDNAFLPNINQVQTLPEILETLNCYLPLAALEVGNHKSLNETLNNFKNSSICILIGPEGGFDESEIEYLNNKNVTTFSLGNHILRAETAAIASISQLVGKFLQIDPEYY